MHLSMYFIFTAHSSNHAYLILQLYYEAGADICETNTFSGTTIAMADYGMEHIVTELNKTAAELCRKAADACATKEKPRFVAGAIGPTNRTLSISPKVEDPGYRNISNLIFFSCSCLAFVCLSESSPFLSIPGVCCCIQTTS